MNESLSLFLAVKIKCWNVFGGVFITEVWMWQMYWDEKHWNWFSYLGMTHIVLKPYADIIFRFTDQHCEWTMAQMPWFD